MEEEVLEMEDFISATNNNYRKEISRGGRSSSSGSWKVKAVSVLVGLSLPILLPAAHMLIFYIVWGTGDNEVDKRSCTCDCWDTVFKGPYESGVGKYKHVFFNSDKTTFKMWVSTVLFFVALYEAIKYVVLLVGRRKVRWSMALLLLSSIHSHYYAWWGHWNYWNDDYYLQWAHQLFFTATELSSSYFVLSQMDKSRPTRSFPLLMISSIAFFHILCGMTDQFYFNVFKMSGKFHQVVRDILLMSTDCLQFCVVLKELNGCAKRMGLTLFKLVTLRKNLVTICGSFCAMLFYILICP